VWLANSLRAVTPVIPQHRSACESGVNTELQQPREPGTSFHQPRRPAQGTSKFKFQDIPGFSEVDCSFRLQETNSSFLYLAPSHRRDLLPPDFYIAGYGIRDTGRQKDIDYPIPYAPQVQQRTPPGALARLSSHELVQDDCRGPALSTQQLQKLHCYSSNNYRLYPNIRSQFLVAPLPSTFTQISQGGGKKHLHLKHLCDHVQSTAIDARQGASIGCQLYKCNFGSRPQITD